MAKPQGAKPAKAKRLTSLIVQNEVLTLKLETERGTVVVDLTPQLAEEVAHIIADGLLALRAGEVPQAAGMLLAPADLSPLRLDEVRTELGAAEKFLLEISSPGATTIRQRLSTESVKRWIETANEQIAQKERQNRQ